MSPECDGAKTVGELLDGATGRLSGCGIEGARHDARVLLAAALEMPVEAVLGYPEREVGFAACQRADAVIERRVRREPVSRILGRREFWGLELALSRDTLDPRPESETLIEAILRHLDDRNAPLRLLDLGTGTGCLLLALLSELPQAQGLGVDVSAATLAVARRNARSLGLAERSAFVCGHWGGALSAPWQVIVSNPPYIITKEIDGLAPEVSRFEPLLALDGGSDGLAAYRELTGDLRRLLALGGLCALEVGEGQAEVVERILIEAGLALLGRARDLVGRDRCVLAGNASEIE